jgi:hypothetical protein
MALAAGLPTIFQDREDVAAGGFGSYRLCQRHTSLEVRQLFMAGPDDEQVEAPTFLRGDPLRITEGPLRITRPQKRGRRMHGWMHVSGTYSW